MQIIRLEDLPKKNYPSGEPIIDIEIESYVEIQATKIMNGEDFYRLMTLISYVANKSDDYCLVMPYLIFSRENWMTDFHPLAILVRETGGRLYTSDCHDERYKEWESVINKVINYVPPNNTTLVVPDKGAAKKSNDPDAIYCSKVRDAKTGKLSGFKIESGDPKGKNLTIIDDICDGGGTFLGLAKILKEAGAKDLHLKVTHGIFSKGKEILLKEFKTVTAIYDYTECTK